MAIKHLLVWVEGLGKVLASLQCKDSTMLRNIPQGLGFILIHWYDASSQRGHEIWNVECEVPAQGSGQGIK
jgi:hypothetical protein